MCARVVVGDVGGVGFLARGVTLVITGSSKWAGMAVMGGRCDIEVLGER